MTNKLWCYQEQGNNGEPVKVCMTEQEILQEYYPHWSRQMSLIGKADQISPESCIEDWVVVHWAESVNG